MFLQGDSGGPLHYLDPNTGKYVVVGIVSLSKCGKLDAPGVYTNVTYFLDWIVDNVDA